MSKKKNKAQQQAPVTKVEANPSLSAPSPAPISSAPAPRLALSSLSFSSFSVQAVILALIGFVFYFNTFNNAYALDDGIIIAKNQYVQQGFKSIPNIMGKDAFDSYYTSLNATNQLSGGRYRPLSIVTFAVEQELFGDSIDYSKVAAAYGVISPEEKGFIHLMHIRHKVNVFLYILSAIVLLYFLRTIAFPEKHLVAFIAALIFVIHPIHTEVVANVKSRDEIMSLLFICCTFICAFRYAETKKIVTLALGLLSFFLALLSKEYAVTLLVLLPLMFYLFRGDDLPKSFLRTLPYIILFGLYLSLRFSVIAPKSDASDDEVLNNPYLFATGAQKLASELAILMRYLSLLFVPHPLSSDYSYKQIPYSDFGSPMVWLSIVVHIGMVAAMYLTFKKRSVLCFAIAFYLLNLLLVSNLIFDIGAPMGERLIYHSSVGFAMVVAYLLYEGYKRTAARPVANAWLGGLMVLLIVLSAFKTIDRNADWKCDHDLFLKDVKTCPQSTVTNANAGACYIGMADGTTDTVLKHRYLDTALSYLNKTLSLHPTFSTGYLNRGVVFYKLGQIVRAKADFDSVKKFFPDYPTLPTLYGLIGSYYLNLGWNDYGKQGKYAEAITYFNKGLEADPKNADLWYNVGGAAYSMQNYELAYTAWQKALQYKPDHPQARAGFNAVSAMLHR